MFIRDVKMGRRWQVMERRERRIRSRKPKSIEAPQRENKESLDLEPWFWGRSGGSRSPPPSWSESYPLQIEYRKLHKSTEAVCTSRWLSSLPSKMLMWSACLKTQTYVPCMQKGWWSCKRIFNWHRDPGRYGEILINSIFSISIWKFFTLSQCREDYILDGSDIHHQHCLPIGNPHPLISIIKQ